MMDVRQRRGLDVVIVGGSLSGLMCGIALKHAGHSVTILEKYGNERPSHMAGVCLGPDAEEFLARHDVIDAAFAHTSYKVQASRDQGAMKVFVRARREITSWDAFYFRLRSCFDGYISSYYPSPPFPSTTYSSREYRHHNQVLDINRASDGERMTLCVQDGNTGNTFDRTADLIIGADGPNSFVRTKYLPEVQRNYVGYIAWRGTVPESEASESTRQVFKESVTLHLMHRQHCVLYTIPGADGSLEPGQRLLNLLWYTNVTLQSLEDIRLDKYGHRHHNIVPEGSVRDDVWRSQLEKAKAIPLPEPLLDVITRIKNPFIQVITELTTTSAAFEGGRVMLVGDALSLYRPHTAFSVTQAAFHAIMVQEYLDGKVSLKSWEEKVLRYAALHRSQSALYGAFYQSHPLITITNGLRYIVYCIEDRLKAWWNREQPLLRSTVKGGQDG